MPGIVAEVGALAVPAVNVVPLVIEPAVVVPAVVIPEVVVPPLIVPFVAIEVPRLNPGRPTAPPLVGPACDWLVAREPGMLLPTTIGGRGAVRDVGAGPLTLTMMSPNCSGVVSRPSMSIGWSNAWRGAAGGWPTRPGAACRF